MNQLQAVTLPTDRDILIAARGRIERGEDRYICYAIDKVGIGMQAQKRALKEWILGMLRPNISYDGWMSNKHSAFIRKHEVVSFSRGRLQWLDWMINEVTTENQK